MTPDEVIALAREARLAEFNDDDFEGGLRFQSAVSGLERFYALCYAKGQQDTLEHCMARVKVAMLGADRELTERVLRALEGR
jgi:hypothetical protein